MMPWITTGVIVMLTTRGVSTGGRKALAPKAREKSNNTQRIVPAVADGLGEWRLSVTILAA
jgi:hypothetical protein